MGKRILLVIVGIIVLAQIVPVERANPPISPTRALEARVEVPPAIHRILDRACYDCHSQRTQWPWYSHMAPVSWVIANDVKQARRKLNFSDWAAYDERQAGRKLEEICEEAKGGEMPMRIYTVAHPASKLTETDRQAVCQWTDSLKNR